MQSVRERTAPGAYAASCSHGSAIGIGTTSAVPFRSRLDNLKQCYGAGRDRAQIFGLLQGGWGLNSDPEAYARGKIQRAPWNWWSTVVADDGT